MNSCERLTRQFPSNAILEESQKVEHREQGIQLPREIIVGVDVSSLPLSLFIFVSLLFSFLPKIICLMELLFYPPCLFIRSVSFSLYHLFSFSLPCSLSHFSACCSRYISSIALAFFVFLCNSAVRFFSPANLSYLIYRVSRSGEGENSSFIVGIHHYNALVYPTFINFFCFFFINWLKILTRLYN